MRLTRGSFIVIPFKQAPPALALALAVIAKAGVNFAAMQKVDYPRGNGSAWNPKLGGTANFSKDLAADKKAIMRQMRSVS
ncbi:hypothetical protein [Novosphingobium sp. KN65.2]|uniref:hypothetical protein n=1 Tax=Novosphingobium sp. KN65.2 TaxID=1478134 RepID=UPI0005DB5081|nr:hypothetical protein [Novosphingobium sp. KN65.2]CDO38803.1 exported hypothetical protein [Novosphingobium sp. KN65.2]